MIAGTHRSRSIAAAAITYFKLRLPRGKEVSRMEKMIKFLKDEEGAHAIEYGLIASLIAVAIIAGATLLGGNLNKMFSFVASKITTQ